MGTPRSCPKAQNKEHTKIHDGKAVYDGREEGKKGGKEEDDGGRDNTALCAKHDTMHISPFIPPPLASRDSNFHSINEVAKEPRD